MDYNLAILHENTVKSVRSKNQWTRGGYEIFSAGGGGFSKNFQKFYRPFLGRPNWITKLSQSIYKNLFWPNFVRRRQTFEETVQKRLLKKQS